MSAMAPGKTASDLYGLPLDQFTAERNELVKRLRAAGDKEEAARVAKLRKPSTAAWAVNQLIRTQNKAVKELFKAGDQMIKAQSQAISGKGSADALKAATKKQRKTTAKLLEAAGGLLNSDGHELPANVRERVSETLRAAAVDPDSRKQVKTGCLAKELQFTGLPGFTTAAPRTSRTAEDKEKRRRDEQITAVREQKNEARQNLTQAKADLAGAEQELTAAQKRRDTAEHHARAAQAALTQAEDRLKQVQRGGT